MHLFRDFHPPYKERSWEYAHANKDEIRECMNNIDLHDKLSSPSADDMVSEFTSTFLSVMSRIIPDKMITFND